jgi:hypothetical protein
MAKQRRSVSRFHEREVARALRAARLAGERPERVEIDPATGRITVIIAQPSEAATSNTPRWRARAVILAVPIAKQADQRWVFGDVTIGTTAAETFNFTNWDRFDTHR